MEVEMLERFVPLIAAVILSVATPCIAEHSLASLQGDHGYTAERSFITSSFGQAADDIGTLTFDGTAHIRSTGASFLTLEQTATGTYEVAPNGHGVIHLVWTPNPPYHQWLASPGQTRREGVEPEEDLRFVLAGDGFFFTTSARVYTCIVAADGSVTHYHAAPNVGWRGEARRIGNPCADEPPMVTSREPAQPRR
jgi:hypothetical protein